MKLILIQCLTLFYTVFSLGIDLPPLPAFPYLENVAAFHNFTLSESTPPTIQSTTLFILLDKNKGESTIIGNGCPDNSTICAITKIDFNNGEDPIITKIFSVAENYTSIRSSPYGIRLDWHRQVWGDLLVDLVLHMRCPYDDSRDDIDFFEWYGGYAGIHEHHNYLEWSSKSFCNTSAIKRGNKSWGLFTILLLVVMVAMTGYLITQAWFNACKRGSSSGFFNELKAVIVQRFSKIQEFIGDVIKYFGSQ